MRLSVALFLCLLSLGACSAEGQPATGSRQPDGDGRAGASGAGNQGNAGASAQPAGAAGTSGAAGSASEICGKGLSVAFASPVDAARGCLDTSRVEPVACATNDGASAVLCIERLRDGQRFWTLAVSTLVADPALFRACPDDSTLPKPCFAEQCASAPGSFCTPETTRERFGCGSPDSEWDAGCCRRRLCSPEGTCAAGEHCAEIPTIAANDCYSSGPERACDCAGTGGGTMKKLCFPD